MGWSAWKPSSLGVYRILLNVFGHKFWSRFEKPRPDIGISGGEFTPAAAAVESSYRIITTSQGLPFPAHTAASILKDRPTNAKELTFLEFLCLAFAASWNTHCVLSTHDHRSMEKLQEWEIDVFLTSGLLTFWSQEFFVTIWRLRLDIKTLGLGYACINDHLQLKRQIKGVLIICITFI